MALRCAQQNGWDIRPLIRDEPAAPLLAADRQFRLLFASNLGIPFGTAYARSRSGYEAVRAQLRRWEADEARGAVRMRLNAMKGVRRPWR